MSQVPDRGQEADTRPAPRRRLSLRIGEEAGRHATWLELFFDLVFVVAIRALAGLLHDDLSVSGFLAFSLLFVPVGWAWMSFAYYADQFDTDDILFRVAMLGAMLASAALAVNIGGALGEDAIGFVAANVALRALLVGLYAWAWRNAPEARPMSARYGRAFVVGAAIWAVSLLVPEPFRYGLWALALLVEMGTPVLGYSTVTSVPGHASHMPERFGLFTLIVLGESIVVITAPLVDTSWRPGSALVAILGFVMAACIWWLYFDHVDDEAIAQSFTSGARGVVRSHVWGYGHLAVWAGISVASVGVEFAIPEATEPTLALGPRAALGGGIALYLLSASAIQLATPSSLDSKALAARLSVAAVCVVLVPLGAYVGTILLVGILAIGLIGLTVYENTAADRSTAEGADAPGA